MQDLADPQVVLRVYNGESRVWGSHDCKIQPGTDDRTLMAGAAGAGEHRVVGFVVAAEQLRQPAARGRRDLHALREPVGTRGQSRPVHDALSIQGEVAHE